MQEIITAITSLWDSVPVWLKAILSLAAGWLVAVLARFLVTGFFTLIRVDKISSKTGLGTFLKKGNITYTPSKLAGMIAYWLILIFAFLEISRILDIEVMRALSGRIMELLPGIIAAALIIIIGVVVVTFVSNFVLTIAHNAGFAHANFLARVIKYFGIILVLSIGFEQMNLGKTIVSSMIQILFGAGAFGIALAFGLGCKDLARDAMQRFIQNLKEKDRTGNKPDLEG